MSTPEPKKETVTSTQNTEPWAAQKPFLEHGFQEARNVYDQGPQQFYPGQTFADPSQETLGAMAGTTARALQGSPTLAAAQAEATKSLSGHYLDAGNPHFGAMADRVRAEVLPGLDSRFMGAGRSGSGMHGRSVGLGLGDAIGSLAYGDYNNERNRMGQYAGMAPEFAAADYLDPQMLGAVGAQREQIAQQPISEAIARHDYGQMAPAESLARYMQMVQGNYGGQSTGTTQQLIPQQNPWMQGLGMLSSVAGMGLGAFARSDVRSKKDIKRIGETDDGLGIYSFRYKTDELTLPKRIGVMAQEVALTKPHAVGVMPDGYLGVDHSRL